MDYGQESIYPEQSTPGVVHTNILLAPEIIEPRNPVRESKEADVFAFGTVAMEVFASSTTFGKQWMTGVISQVSEGRSPRELQDAEKEQLTDEMWTAIQRYWNENIRGRPTIARVVEEWERFAESNGDSQQAPGGPDSTQETSAATEPQQPGKSVIPRGFQVPSHLIFGCRSTSMGLPWILDFQPVTCTLGVP